MGLSCSIDEQQNKPVRLDSEPQPHLAPLKGSSRRAVQADVSKALLIQQLELELKKLHYEKDQLARENEQLQDNHRNSIAEECSPAPAEYIPLKPEHQMPSQHVPLKKSGKQSVASQLPTHEKFLRTATPHYPTSESHPEEPVEDEEKLEEKRSDVEAEQEFSETITKQNSLSSAQLDAGLALAEANTAKLDARLAKAETNAVRNIQLDARLAKAEYNAARELSRTPKASTVPKVVFKKRSNKKYHVIMSDLKNELKDLVGEYKEYKRKAGIDAAIAKLHKMKEITAKSPEESREAEKPREEETKKTGEVEKKAGFDPFAEENNMSKMIKDMRSELKNVVVLAGEVKKTQRARKKRVPDTLAGATAKPTEKPAEPETPIDVRASVGHIFMINYGGMRVPLRAQLIAASGTRPQTLFVFKIVDDISPDYNNNLVLKQGRIEMVTSGKEVAGAREIVDDEAEIAEKMLRLASHKDGALVLRDDIHDYFNNSVQVSAQTEAHVWENGRLCGYANGKWVVYPTKNKLIGVFTTEFVKSRKADNPVKASVKDAFKWIAAIGHPIAQEEVDEVQKFMDRSLSGENNRLCVQAGGGVAGPKQGKSRVAGPQVRRVSAN